MCASGRVSEKDVCCLYTFSDITHHESEFHMFEGLCSFGNAKVGEANVGEAKFGEAKVSEAKFFCLLFVFLLHCVAGWQSESSHEHFRKSKDQ